jgi:hypothetical protein
MMDKLERRKQISESGDVPCEFLGPEIHRKLSEASESPKERDEVSREGPDPRYLNEEMQRELSEVSRKDERIGLTVDRAIGIEEPEHSTAKAEDKTLDVGKQITQEARQNGARECAYTSEHRPENNSISQELEISEKQVEQQAEARRTNEAKPKQIGVEKDAIVGQLPESKESKLDGKASEHSAEQVIQEKEDHSGGETHQISETRQQNECDRQSSEAKQDMHTKSEQIGLQSNSTDKQIPDRVKVATKEQLAVRIEEKQEMEIIRQEKESAPKIEGADNIKGLKNGLISDESNRRSYNKEPALERQAEIGHYEKYSGEYIDKHAEHLKPVVKKDINFLAEQSQARDVAKSKDNDTILEINKNRFQPAERLSCSPEEIKHLEKLGQRTEKDERVELRKHLDRIRELSPKTYMFVEKSLDSFLKKKDETSVVSLVRETADYLEASKGRVPKQKPTIKGVYQNAHGNIEPAIDALHALARYHRTGDIEIRLHPIKKGKKTEIYIPRELWKATAQYEAVKFNLTFPNGEKTVMYKPPCRGRYKEAPSLCKDIADKLRTSKQGVIDAKIEEITKEQLIKEMPKREDVDYEFKGKNLYIKIGDRRIKAHDVRYSFARSSPTTTSELKISFNIIDRKLGTKEAFIISYDGRNPPKTQVVIGSHPEECHFSYNRKLNCIEVSYKRDTGRKTGEHRIDHVKVIDMRTHPEKILIDLNKQTGVVSEELLEMTRGSTTKKGAAGNIVCGEVQRAKYRTYVRVESNGNDGGVDVEIPSQRKFIEACMCTNEKHLLTSLATAEIKALKRSQQSIYRNYTAVAMAVYIDRKNGHLKYIEKIVKE